MSFYWEVSINGNGNIKEGNWGRDVNCNADIKRRVLYIKLVSTKNENRAILIDPNSGVFYIDKGTALQHLAANIGGYNYVLSTETENTVLDFCPFSVAVVSMDTQESKILDRHFMLKYRVTKVLDKVSGSFISLDEPVELEFLIGFVKESGIYVSSRRI